MPVASCILNPAKLHNLKVPTDSKKQTERKPDKLYPLIVESALDYCIVHVSPSENDGNRIPKGLITKTDYLVNHTALKVGDLRNRG